MTAEIDARRRRTVMRRCEQYDLGGDYATITGVLGTASPDRGLMIDRHLRLPPRAPRDRPGRPRRGPAADNQLPDGGDRAGKFEKLGPKNHRGPCGRSRRPGRKSRPMGARATFVDPLQDAIDEVSFDRLARAARGLEKVMAELVGEARE